MTDVIHPAIPAPRRQTGLVVGMLAVACMVPFLLSPIVEAVDVPSHLLRIHVLAAHGANPDLARAYTMSPRWVGNLGVDLPALLLAPMMGAEAAVRLLVALTAPLTILGLWMLSRAAHGRFTAGAAIALPLVLSQTAMWGFANYNVSVALVLMVAALWRRRPPATIPDALLFGLAGLGVWTAHAMGWAALLMLVAGMELAGLWGRWRALPGRVAMAVPLLAPLLPMAWWRAPDSAPLYRYAADVLNGKIMDIETVLRGVDKVGDIALTCAMLAAAAMLLGLSRRLDARLATGAAVLALAAMAMPSEMMGSWAADLRLVPLALMVGFVAIVPVPPRAERALLLVGCALLLVRVGTVAARWYGEGARHARLLPMLDHVPRGGRMGYALIEPCGFPWPLSADTHLGSYATIRRDAFVNTSFLVKGADLIGVRAPRDAAWVAGTQLMSAGPCAGYGAPTGAWTERLPAMARDFPMIWLVAGHGGALPRGIGVADMHVVATGPGSVLLSH